jgi:hypothetical protein
VAPLHLEVDVLLDLVQGDVARPFNHHLHVLAPGDLGQLAEGPQLAELGLVVGVGDRPGAQPVPEGEGDVVGGEDLAQLFEVGVEEILLVVGQAPGGQDRPAPAHDAGDPGGGERHVAEQDTGVHGHVVDALLGLLDDGVAVRLPGEVGR